MFLRTKNTSIETIFTHLNSYSVLKTTTRLLLTANIHYIVVHRIGNPHSTQAAIGWRAMYILRVFCEHSWKGSFWTGFGRDGGLVGGGARHPRSPFPAQFSSAAWSRVNAAFFSAESQLRNILLEVFRDGSVPLEVKNVIYFSAAIRHSLRCCKNGGVICHQNLTSRIGLWNRILENLIKVGCVSPM